MCWTFPDEVVNLFGYLCILSRHVDVSRNRLDRNLTEAEGLDIEHDQHIVDPINQFSNYLE
jgi:hypothetical protein